MSDEKIHDEQQAAAASEQNPDAVETAPETKPDAIGVYDFRSARSVSANNLSHLDRVNERFCRDFPASLTALIRRKVSARVASSKFIESREAGADLPATSLTILLSAEPGDTQVVLGMNSQLVFSLFEALLGGGGGDANFDRRPTDLELSVLQDLQELTLRQLEEAWQKSAKYLFRVSGQSTDLKPADIPSLADGFVAVEFEFQIESGSGLLLVLYPASMLKGLGEGEPFRSRSGEASPVELPEQVIFRRLKRAEVKLEGCLQGPTLKIRDLVDLRVNDLVCLDAPLERPISVLVNGQSRFQGRLVSMGRKRAVRIENLLRPAGAESATAQEPV